MCAFQALALNMGASGFSASNLFADALLITQPVAHAIYLAI
jgi:hypothetical protein